MSDIEENKNELKKIFNRKKEIKTMCNQFYEEINKINADFSEAKKARDNSRKGILLERKTGLEKAKSSLKQEERELNIKISELEKKLHYKGGALEHKNSVQQTKFNGTVEISEHCVLRYIERKYGISIDGIKKDILKEVSTLNAIGGLSNSKYVIRDNVVITYLESSQVPSNLRS